MSVRGGAVQLLLGVRDLHLGGAVLRAYLRCAAALPRGEGPPLRVLVTEDAGMEADSDADAVVLLETGCTRQDFPPDLKGEPIRLRLPLTQLSLRVALEYALSRGEDRAAGPPDPERADQASERLVADSRPSRPASMSKVTA